MKTNSLYNPIIDALDEARAEALAEAQLLRFIVVVGAILVAWFFVVNVGAM